MEWSEWLVREALRPSRSRTQWIYSYATASDLITSVDRLLLIHPEVVLVQVISTWNPARQSESDFPGSSDDAGLSSAVGYRERRAIRSSVHHPSACRRHPSWWTGMKLTTDWYCLNDTNLKLKRIQPDCCRSHPLPLCNLSRISGKFVV